MKLLTLNTHSLQGGPRQLEDLADFLARERPDLAALQEVNQTRRASDVPEKLTGRSVGLTEDNFVLLLDDRLAAMGVNDCEWMWLPVKTGYGRFDEGVALLSFAGPFAESGEILLSARDDYSDWRTRKALGVRLEGSSDWFYSVHMGWWGDSEDPFRDQWARLEAGVARKRETGTVWLMGDFNAPAHVPGEGYDLMVRSGWWDAHAQARDKDGGFNTVEGAIDGWRERLKGPLPDGMRIDYIWSSRPVDIASCQVVLNGTRGPVVSDHYGVLAETGKGDF